MLLPFDSADLNDILRDGRRVQLNVYDRDLQALEGDERQFYLSQMLLGLSAEVGELIQECDWKYWRETAEIDISLLNEIGDIMIFLSNICGIYGFTGDDLAAAIYRKYRRNIDRDSAVGERKRNAESQSSGD